MMYDFVVVESQRAKSIRTDFGPTTSNTIHNRKRQLEVAEATRPGRKTIVGGRTLKLFKFGSG